MKIILFITFKLFIRIIDKVFKIFNSFHLIKYITNVIKIDSQNIDRYHVLGTHLTLISSVQDRSE